jgi:hypothetical protein
VIATGLNVDTRVAVWECRGGELSPRLGSHAKVRTLRVCECVCHSPNLHFALRICLVLSSTSSSLSFTFTLLPSTPAYRSSPSHSQLLFPYKGPEPRSHRGSAFHIEGNKPSYPSSFVSREVLIQRCSLIVGLRTSTIRGYAYGVISDDSDPCFDRLHLRLHPSRSLPLTLRLSIPASSSHPLSAVNPLLG